MTEKKTLTFEEYQKALTDKIVDGFALRPYQRAFVDALNAPSGKGPTFKFPRYHTGGVISPSKTDIRPILSFDSRIEVRNYRQPKPRTDDMIQMLADFERHGYPRRVSIHIAIKDNISRVIEGMALKIDQRILDATQGRGLL